MGPGQFSHIFFFSENKAMALPFYPLQQTCQSLPQALHPKDSAITSSANQFNCSSVHAVQITIIEGSCLWAFHGLFDVPSSNLFAAIAWICWFLWPQFIRNTFLVKVLYYSINGTRPPTHSPHSLCVNQTAGRGPVGNRLKSPLTGAPHPPAQR